MTVRDVSGFSSRRRRLLACPTSVALLLLVLCGGAAAKASSAVLELSSEDFDERVTKGTWLVEFMAPWCGHCKRLAPTYEQVAKDLKGKVQVAKVDGTKHQGLAARFPFGGYPSIFHIQNSGSEVREFNGVRNLEGIKHFATSSFKKVKPLSTFSSPFGPVGRVKGKIMGIGARVTHSYHFLKDEWGMGPIAAGLLLTFVGISVTIVGAFFAVWLFIPSSSDDPFARRRAHAD